MKLTAVAIRRQRLIKSCGLQEAKKQLTREYFHDQVTNAKTLEELKTVMHEVIDHDWGE